MWKIKKLSYKNIFENANLELHSGDWWLLQGANGSGKTTLAKILAGIIKDYTGEYFYYFNNKIQEIKKLSLKQIGQIISFVFSETENNFFTETVLAEICFPNSITETNLVKIDELLNSLNLTKLKNSNPYFLSQGEKKRLNLAIALFREPKLLILDESLIGLDEENKNFILEYLKNLLLKNRNLTIIFISHDLETILPYVNKIAIIKDKNLITGDLTQSLKLIAPEMLSPYLKLVKNFSQNKIYFSPVKLAKNIKKIFKIN